jgi:hypothetical protein
MIYVTSRRLLNKQCGKLLAGEYCNRESGESCTTKPPPGTGKGDFPDPQRLGGVAEKYFVSRQIEIDLVRERDNPDRERRARIRAGTFIVTTVTTAYFVQMRALKSLSNWCSF